jgi:glutamate formiminotransferase
MSKFIYLQEVDSVYLTVVNVDHISMIQVVEDQGHLFSAVTVLGNRIEVSNAQQEIVKLMKQTD